MLEEPLHDEGQLLLNREAEVHVLPQTREANSDKHGREGVESDHRPVPDALLMLPVDGRAEEEWQLEDGEDLLIHDGGEDEGGEGETVDSAQEGGVLHGGIALGERSLGIIEEMATDENEEIFHNHNDEHEAFRFEASKQLGEEIIHLQQLENAKDRVDNERNEKEQPMRFHRGCCMENNTNGRTHKSKGKDLRELERATSHLVKQVGEEEQSIGMAITLHLSSPGRNISGEERDYERKEVQNCHLNTIILDLRNETNYVKNQRNKPANKANTIKSMANHGKIDDRPLHLALLEEIPVHRPLIPKYLDPTED